MANLTEKQLYDAAVYELATTDPVLGGPGGVDNKPHQQLTNRTAWLKQQVDALLAAGGSMADITAAINAHLAATDPHPQYTTNAEVLALIVANAPAAPVQSIAGKTGAVTLTPADVGALPAAQKSVASGIESLMPAGQQSLTPMHGMAAFNGKAILLPNDYPLQTWSDALSIGQYNVSLSVPQNGLPAGWWYINVYRHYNDLSTNQYRIIEARGLDNNANEIYQATEIRGVWTPFVRIDSTGAKSLTANGYQVLPSGLIIQWGRQTPIASGTFITYPLAFPTAIGAVSLSEFYSSINTPVFYTSNAIQLNGFTAYSFNSVTGAAFGGTSLQWMAIGY